MSLIPVYTYLKPGLHDDINYNGCPYTKKIFDYHGKDPIHFADDAAYVFPVAKAPVAQAFS